MFSEFRYEDFKSYRKAEFPLSPLTLLVGTNASGKSNALEGIRFLSWLSQGQRLDDALRAVQEDEEIRRWLTQFPEYAEQEVEFGDMSIVEAFRKQCDRHPSRHVFIWAIDSDLSNYDRQPQV
jgi:recombinational DNA repair ATPase RecF